MGQSVEGVRVFRSQLCSEAPLSGLLPQHASSEGHLQVQTLPHTNLMEAIARMMFPLPTQLACVKVTKSPTSPGGGTCL